MDLIPSENSRAATETVEEFLAFPPNDMDRAKKLVEGAQGITRSDDHDGQFWAAYTMAMVEEDLDTARDQLECAKSHAAILRNRYLVGISWYELAKLCLLKGEIWKQIPKPYLFRAPSKILGT